MVDAGDNEKFGKQEYDEEYHFTDDQPEYDLHTKGTLELPGQEKSEHLGKQLAEKLRQNRRILVSVVIFLFLLGFVYRMLVPVSSISSNVDITQSVSGTAEVRPIASSASRGATEPTQSDSSSDLAEPNVTSAAVTAVLPPPVTAITKEVTATSLPTAAAIPVSETSAVPVKVTAEVQSELDNNANNSSEKLANIQLQNSEMRSQIKALTERVAVVEKTFHQLIEMLQGMKSGLQATAGDEHSAQLGESLLSSPEPQATSQANTVSVGYSVQAIIPGRAWLKSNAGDTITVAEGDILKGVGRVTRIDPYDGIVSVNTGKKTVTPSYGMGGD